MKFLRNLCLFISILAFMSLCVEAKTGHAATLYVATTGSDANPGTAAAPFRTVQKGARSIDGGDTLIVKGGTYAEGNISLPSGSSGAPTILQAASGETVILQPNNKNIDCIICLSNGLSWVTIDGLILDGGSPGGTRLTAFPVYDTNQHTSTVSHIIIQNSEIKNGRHSCFLVAGSQWTVQNNHIHHCGTDTTLDHGMYFSGNNSTITNNVMDNNACYNIQNYSAVGQDVSNNIHTRNIYTASGCGVTVEYNNNGIFANNIIYNDAQQGRTPALLCCGAGAKIYNNTVYGNNTTGIHAEHRGTDTGAQIRNNISCNNSGGNIITISASTSNNLTSCPSFVNAGAGDFHLAVSSPAIDAGATLSEVAVDFDNVPRPQGTSYDIGAYEFTSSVPRATPIPAPRNLRTVSQP